MALTIRPSFDQIGVLYSVQNVSSGEVSAFRPGGVFPYIGVTPIRATTAARPLRCWVLNCDVTILTSAGTPQVEGHIGDYLIELEYGDLLIVRADGVRSEYDLEGDIGRLYRNTMAGGVCFSDVAKIYDKNGRELQ